MKYYFITICIIILFLVGCVPEKAEQEKIQPTIQPEESVEEPEERVEEKTEEEQLCTEMWVCKDDTTIGYRKSDCSFEQLKYCEAGCENGECKELTKETEEKEQIEEKELSEEEQINQIFNNSKKLTSYSCRYKDPAGTQYDIYVKGNKIRIDYVSNNYKIYLDTEKKIAEKYCISHSSCGKETGKVADLDYYNTYIETPVDWLAKIKEAKKIDQGFYYGKQSWKLNTNIGEVIIDSHFGFISSIKKDNKAYLFIDSSFNMVKDSDVNVPEYLIGK